MRTAALIEDSKVSNVIVIADGATGDSTLAEFGAIEVTGQDVGIGDVYEDGVFVRVKTEQELAAEAAQAEYLEKRRALGEKLGLTEDEIRLLLS